MEKNKEPLKAVFRWEAYFEASTGRLSPFFRELKENKKILGSKCPDCQVVYCPPIADCPKCWGRNEWVEIGPKGTLIAFSYVPSVISNAPPAVELGFDPPYGFGLIQLDGADTSLLHFVREIDVEDLRPGLRVEAVMREKREGYITDIAYFKVTSS
ncbi:MAG: Zn-ribbon domain-containing OB-fold protein [Thermodesulfobacteriota bacterium]|nr:Zn-ribbon domain-containing OB-fold protein [Thermodesulfobacteriota bacterium]